MPSNNEIEAKKLLDTFLERDVKRKKDPVLGQRAAEETLMQLCELLKKHGDEFSKGRDAIVDKLRGMNLVPYRSYCREHLLDVGITNV